MASLQDLLAVINAEPVLVISAEGHPEDLNEAASAFARCGVRRAIVTKLDVTRRRGGIVSALISAKDRLFAPCHHAIHWRWLGARDPIKTGAVADRRRTCPCRT